MTDGEIDSLLAMAGEMVQKIALPCTACHYCVSHCPQGLDIPNLLALYNEHCFTGGGFIAPMVVSTIAPDKRPSACIGCRSCEAVVPSRSRSPKPWQTLPKNSADNKEEQHGIP